LIIFETINHDTGLNRKHGILRDPYEEDEDQIVANIRAVSQ
jgi:hypothetical protein